ncbi:hypothetical protein ES332_A10G121000v1 [Gossypium tomentosum]|uniref:Uncharacterized protein n=1 Tax=Gossypium tomentosum TaxID=34277 RepID=A0A5D2NR94_GOSTO|nr:hypothetical protein ES332_A10G121000v1 [Gossypium tomentosum]
MKMQGHFVQQNPLKLALKFTKITLISTIQHQKSVALAGTLLFLFPNFLCSWLFSQTPKRTLPSFLVDFDPSILEFKIQL